MLIGATLLYLLLAAAALLNILLNFDRLKEFWKVASSASAEEADQQQTMLPSWRIVTDCSTYATDCATHLQGRLLDYPFQVKMPNVVGEDGQYDFERIRAEDGLPEEWHRALIDFVPPMPDKPTKMELDGDRMSALVFPPKVSKEQASACYKKGLITTFDKQLDTILSKLHPVDDIDAIAYTMTDEKYSHDMIHDVWEMNNDIVGFRDAFFFLALDKYTLRLACEYGYPVVAAPGLIQSNKNAKDESEGNLKELVQSTKFTVSRALVEPR